MWDTGTDSRRDNSITLSIVSGMDQSIKVRENRLRRAADRQGLRLEKCGRRDPRALGYGTYRLTNADGVVTASTGPSGYGLTLDQIEAELNR